MQTDDMIFRTVYVDLAVDRAALADARRLGAPAGSVYCAYLETGLTQMRSGVRLPPADDQSSVIGTVDVAIASDQLLQALSLRLNLDQADLNRRVTRLGMGALQNVKIDSNR